MTRRRRRKCCNCGGLYVPDPRNRWHQKHCSQANCRAASKALSQRRWRQSSKGCDYFDGNANVQRVRAWRKDHPGYWRGKPKEPVALQDVSSTQTIAPTEHKQELTPDALQEILFTQRFILLGLVANLTGSALQENIATTTQRLIRFGRQIDEQRNGRGASNASGETCALQGTLAQDPRAVQLGRSPLGSG